MAQPLSVPEGYEAVPATPAPEGYEPVAAPGLMESFGRGMAEGATFGYDDKLGLDKERREASRKANPWTHFMGEMAGGIAPMVAAGGLGAVAKGAGMLPTIGRGIAAALAPGEIGTLGQGMKEGAKLGATYGALSGSGHADVKDDDSYADALAKRGVAGLKGGAEGAIVGPVLGAAGHGVFRGAQAIGGMRAVANAETDLGSGALTTAVNRMERDRISPQDIIDQIRSEFPDDTASAGLTRRFWGGLQNKQPITADQVEETVRRAMNGESAVDISKALSPAGKGTGPGEGAVQSLLDELAERHLGPLNLVDRTSLVRPGAGENTQMTMRAAAATPGEHLGIARENLLERQVGAQGRMGQLFDRMLGSSDYTGVAAKHATDLEDAGAKAYSAAFANEKPFNLTPLFDNWAQKYGGMAGPIPDAINGELKNMLVNGQPPSSLEGFIMARQGLSDAIGAAQRGGKDNLARRLTELNKDLSGEVRRTNPDWAIANDIWRDGKVGQEALEAGARMTTRLNASSRENLSHLTDAQDMAKKAKTALDKARSDLGKVAPGSQQEVAARGQMISAQARIDAANARSELFKVGLVRALNDMMANQGETHNLTKQLLLPGARQQLTKALGKDADQFFKTVRAEQAMHRTYQSQFGSQTTPLREHVDELNWAPSFQSSLHNPLHWPSKLLDLAAQYGARNINAARNKELMGLYTETDPVKQLEFLRAAQGVHAARSQAGNLAGKPVVSAAGPGADALLGQQSGMEYQPQTLKPYRP